MSGRQACVLLSREKASSFHQIFKGKGKFFLKKRLRTTMLEVKSL